MTHTRTAEEIRRFDLMKLGVLLLLIVLLFLTWLVTREDGALDLTGEAEATAVAEATAATDGLTREPGTVVAPTLAAPVISAPSGALAPEGLTLSGVAGPGARVQLLADGQPIGQASAGVDGAWSLTATLPAGQQTLVAQTLDNVGSVVAESAPLTVTVGPAPTAGVPEDGGGQWTTATFNPLADTWTLAGVAAPNVAIVVMSGGAPLGQTTADSSGNWSLDAPAAAVADTIVVQSSDGGAAIAAPVAIGPRPPGVVAPGQSTTAPDGSGVVVVPVGVVNWTGQAAPGTQVEVVIDGQRAGVVTVDAGGNWSLPVELPAGPHTIQINSLDAAGGLLAAGQSLAVETATTVEGPGTPIAEATTATEATPAAEATTETEPPADTILAALQSRPELSTLLAAVETAGLAERLAAPGALTVFAPTNDAFAALPQSAVDALLANPEALAALLRYHVARGRYTAADLRIVQPATLDGRLLTVAAQGDGITVNGATVLAADVAAGSGLIHVVDRILLPPLAAGVRPPIIDESGVSTFVGPRLTVVGTAQPGRTIRVEIDGQAFGEATVVDVNGNWQVSGDVVAGEHRLVAFMLNGATLEAFSRPVALTVR